MLQLNSSPLAVPAWQLVWPKASFACPRVFRRLLPWFFFPVDLHFHLSWSLPFGWACVAVAGICSWVVIWKWRSVIWKWRSVCHGAKRAEETGRYACRESCMRNRRVRIAIFFFQSGYEANKDFVQIALNQSEYCAISNKKTETYNISRACFSK